MSRSVELWRGKTDDTVAPPRVRARVFLAKHGLCHKCGRKIGPADHWTLEHLIALINGGSNSEDNLDVTCDWCLPGKNAVDAALKSKSAKIRQRHLGIKPVTRPIQSPGFRRHPSNARQVYGDIEDKP